MATPRSAGRQLVDAPVADVDFAAVDILEAGDHPQQRGLAAARRAEEHHELARADGHRDVLDDAHSTEVLADVYEPDIGQVVFLPGRPRPARPLRISRAGADAIAADNIVNPVSKESGKFSLSFRWLA
jgi:hypothetical protein